VSYSGPTQLDDVSPSIPGDLQAGEGGVESKPLFIPAVNCARVEIRFEQDDQDFENVIWIYQASGAWSYAQLVALAGQMVTNVTTNLLPVMSSSCHFMSVRCSDWTTSTGSVYLLSLSTPLSGGLTDDAAPLNNCVGIAFGTGFKGRSQTGRMFLGGCVVTDFGENLAADATRTARKAALVAFCNAITANGGHMAVVSFYHNKLWRTTAQITTIVFVAVGEYIYTMRRRLPGHNRHR
jgi:hypothetical protein